MEIPKYLKKFRIAKVNPRYEEAKEVADKLGFDVLMILKFQKNLGQRYVYELFQEVWKSDFVNRPALFLKKISETGIIWS